jgi:hypothetical protein
LKRCANGRNACHESQRKPYKRDSAAEAFQAHGLQHPDRQHRRPRKKPCTGARCRWFYALSPAFDVLPAAQGLGYQQMRVVAKGHEASMANALSEVAAFGLSKVDAGLIALQIATHVDSWKTEFLVLNATPADMAVLSQYLDGSVLSSERLKSIALT